MRESQPDGGGIWASGGTGDAPVCCARWWDRRPEMANPVTMALPKTIKPMATVPAISTISIWIATVYLALRCFPLSIRERSGQRDSAITCCVSSSAGQRAIAAASRDGLCSRGGGSLLAVARGSSRELGRDG